MIFLEKKGKTELVLGLDCAPTLINLFSCLYNVTFIQFYHAKEKHCRSIFD